MERWTDCPSENEVLDLLQGHLDEEAAEVLRAHFDVCSSCHALVARLAGSERTVSDASALGELRAWSPGDVLAGRYRLLSVLGSGGAGVVFEAHDAQLERRVALKLLHSSRAGDSHRRERLLRESRVMARLRHPNVVTVYDVGVSEDATYIAMELIEGASARAWSSRALRSWREVLDVYLQAARGLLAAHDKGVIHRDFKPDNLLIDDAGRAYVTDFGLARSPTGWVGQPTGVQGAVSQASLTISGAIVGTPAYLAPEQFRGEPAGTEADVFSFCVALYEALWGQRPFVASTIEGIQAAIEEQRFAELPRGVTVPRWLDRAVRSGLAFDPERRPSLSVLARRLESSRPRIAILGGAGVLSAAAAVLWIQMGTTMPAVPACEDVPDRSLFEPSLAATQAFASSLSSEAAARLAHTLSSYADDWLAAWHRVCSVPVTDDAAAKIVDARVRCLNLRRRALDVHLQRLVEGNIELNTTLRRLPGPRFCERPDFDVVFELVDEDNQARDAELWSRLARLQDRQQAGELAGTRAELADVVEEIRATGSASLLAEALYVEGSGFLFSGDADPARTKLLEAAQAAMSSGSDLIALMSWNGLAYIAIELLPDHERADEYVGNAHAALERLGSSPLAAEQRVAVLFHEGLLRLRQRRFDDAEDVLQRGLEAARSDDPRLVDRFVALQGQLYAERGDLERALETSREVLELRLAQLGAEHPAVAFAHQGVAANLAEMGDYAAALDAFRQARAVYAASSGEASPTVREMLRMEALMLTRLSRFDQAEEALARGKGDAASQKAARPIEIELAIEKGELERAHRVALERLDEAKGSDDLSERWGARASLAFVQLEMGEPVADRTFATEYAAASAELELDLATRQLCGWVAGRALAAANDPRQAIEVLEATLDAVPKRFDPETRREIEVVLESVRRTADAGLAD